MQKGEKHMSDEGHHFSGKQYCGVEELLSGCAVMCRF